MKILFQMYGGYITTLIAAIIILIAFISFLPEISTAVSYYLKGIMG